MASLFLTVWETAGATAHGDPSQIMTPVTVDGTSRQSEAVAANKPGRKTVRFFTDTDCFVNWGADPTVTDGTDAIPLGAENPEYWDVENGDKIAVIQRT